MESRPVITVISRKPVSEKKALKSMKKFLKEEKLKTEFGIDRIEPDIIVNMETMIRFMSGGSSSESNEIVDDTHEGLLKDQLFSLDTEIENNVHHDNTLNMKSKKKRKSNVDERKSNIDSEENNIQIDEINNDSNNSHIISAVKKKKKKDKTKD